MSNWQDNPAVLRSRTFVVSPGTVIPVEAGGADVRDLSAVDPQAAHPALPSAALPAIRRAHQAYLRFERRVPVQLELVP